MLIPPPPGFTPETWETFQADAIAALADGEWHQVTVECKIDPAAHETEYLMLAIDETRVDFSGLNSPPAQNKYSKAFWTFSLQIDSRKTTPPVYVDMTEARFYYWLD